MKNTTSNVDLGLGMHLESYDNPHLVTKAQVGLGNVEDVKQYSQLNPPPNYIESVCGKKPDEAGNIKLVKGDVGLGKVDNLKQYSEVNQPPYPVTSVNGMKGDVIIEAGAGGDTGALEDAINAHIANTTNPHDVTKAQIGLDKVDNTKDEDKPISNAVKMALDTKLNASDYIPCDGVQIEADLAAHTANKQNPHVVTKDQIGLSNVPNVVPYHAGNKPTKADLCLGNVDNTSDIDKPISSLTQAVLDGKLNVCDYSASDVLSKIKTVDGSGSGLDADLLDGKQAANSANSIPVLDVNAKLPISQIPTGTSASTVAIGSHTHSAPSITYATSYSQNSTTLGASAYLTNSLDTRSSRLESRASSLESRLAALESKVSATEAQLSPGITGAYTLDGRIITFRKGIMVQVSYA